jgi:SAM-dependent methyltransferase
MRALDRMRASGPVRRLRATATRLRYPEARSPSEHWQRVELNRAIDRYLRELPTSRLSAAEISGSAHASRPWRAYTSLNFPDFDLCAPLELEAGFDVVICEQVLEHVVDPCAAARNLRGLCAPGGHVVVSTPFLVRVHELAVYGMHDYWRFTPRGLRTLLERAGLQVDAVGSWGNRRCVSANFDSWPAYRFWRALDNEPDLPLQVWAFARNMPEAPGSA